MKKRPITREVIDHAYRLQQIIEESADIIRTTNNNDTKQSRIDVALKNLIELKGLSEVYPGIKIKNLTLIEWQLVKAKYEHLKKEFGE